MAQCNTGSHNCHGEPCATPRLHQREGLPTILRFVTAAALALHTPGGCLHALFLLTPDPCEAPMELVNHQYYVQSGLNCSILPQMSQFNASLFLQLGLGGRC